jgi:2-polyprenyl-3-methyl-5-hydroxy-6-metoxy-1,4-benzoquinol methylase
MRWLKLWEAFSSETLNTNISCYNKYVNNYKNDRAKMVAWVEEESQIKNFRMVFGEISNGDSILDYGCGIGDFISFLNDNGRKISDYLGVDINDNYIEIAKKSYPGYDFKTISGIEDLSGNFDVVCAIGVFTWFITKEDFIKTINKLVEISNKSVVLTLLYGKTPYDDISNKEDIDDYWKSTYKKFDENLFYKLFPDLNFKFYIDDLSVKTIKVTIIKK